MASEPRWPALVVWFLLPTCLLVAFGRLVADPSGLLVDPNRPSLDQNQRGPHPPTVGNDATRLFLPHHAAIADRLARLGRVPTWDDRGFAGRPLVGNPQSGVLYPPVWLAWRFWSPAALGWITVAHLLWAGFGTYALARSVGLGVWGRTMAAGCFQLSPYVLAQAFEGHYPHVWSASWFPWALLLFRRANQGSVLAGLFLVPVLALTFLAGHAQESVALFLALGAKQAVILANRRPKRFRDLLSPIGSIGAIIALVAGMTAVEWLPDAAISSLTLRDGPLPSDLAGRYHLFPSNALQLLNPFALGRPADYFGHDNYWEALTALGLIPLSLVLVALIWFPDRRALRPWWILTLVLVWYAAGRQLGLFSLLYEVVPGLSRFRVPARTLFLASLAASVLAGFGVDTLAGPSVGSQVWPRWSRMTTRLLIPLAIVVLIAGWVVPPHLADPTRARISELARVAEGLARVGREPTFWLAVGALLVVAQCSQRWPATRPNLAAVLVVLGLIELSALGASLLVVAPANQFVGHDPITASLPPPNPGAGPLRVRVVDVWFDDLRAQAHNLHKTNLNDSFQIRHAAALYEPLYRLFLLDPFDLGRPLDAAVSNHRQATQQAILDRLGVRVLIADQPPARIRWPTHASGLWRGQPYTIATNPTALPRAYVVPTTRPPEEFGPGLAGFSRVDPRQSVLMDRDPLASNGPRNPYQPATWLHDEVDRIHLEVTTRAPSLLVIADTWMPGWTATVDDQPETIEMGNLAQRVIPIRTPGRHQVALQYQPLGLQQSQGIWEISVSLWLCLTLVTLGRKTRMFSNVSWRIPAKTDQVVDSAPGHP